VWHVSSNSVLSYAYMTCLGDCTQLLAGVTVHLMICASRCSFPMACCLSGEPSHTTYADTPCQRLDEWFQVICKVHGQGMYACMKAVYMGYAVLVHRGCCVLLSFVTRVHNSAMSCSCSTCVRLCIHLALFVALLSLVYPSSCSPTAAGIAVSALSAAQFNTVGHGVLSCASH
jgi:hypothetical protein